MTYWKNYRAAKERGLILDISVESAGLNRDVVVINRKVFNKDGTESIEREVLNLEEAVEQRKKLEEEVLDMKAWIADVRPKVLEYREQEAARKAALEAQVKADAEAEKKRLAEEEAARLLAQQEATRLEEEARLAAQAEDERLAAEAAVEP